MDFWTFVGIVILLVIVGEYALDCVKASKGLKDD